MKTGVLLALGVLAVGAIASAQQRGGYVLASVLSTDNDAQQLQITQLGTPIDPDDAATKGYSDAAAPIADVVAAQTQTTEAQGGVSAARARIASLQSALQAKATAVNAQLAALDSRVMARRTTSVQPGVAATWTGWIELAGQQSWTFYQNQNASMISWIAYRQGDLPSSSSLDAMWFTLPPGVSGRLSRITAHVRGSRTSARSDALSSLPDPMPSLVFMSQGPGADYVASSSAAVAVDPSATFGAAYNTPGSYQHFHQITFDFAASPRPLDADTRYFVYVMGEDPTVDHFSVQGLRATILAP